MLSTLRWASFLPLAFIASVLAGALASWLGELFGGSSWYVWLVSGAASAWCFFYVALHVAPRTSQVVKWTSVAIVAALGLMAALGPLITGRNPISSLAGVVMIGFAVGYSRMPVSAIVADVRKTLDE